MRNPFETSSSWSSSHWPTSWSRLPATAGVVVSTALLAGLAYAVWRSVRTTHVSRRGARAGGQPEDLTRWEGEGGGVPVGGSRTAAELNRSSGVSSGVSSGMSSSGSSGVSGTQAATSSPPLGGSSAHSPTGSTGGGLGGESSSRLPH